MSSCHNKDILTNVNFALKNLPRLFTDFSEIVAIASPLMKNVLSTIEMLLDL